MNGPDDQALILGALVGMSAATVGIAALIWWWIRCG